MVMKQYTIQINLISENVNKKTPGTSYVLRHSSLTEKSLILKEHVFKKSCQDTAHVFKNAPGLSYTISGNESVNSILEARGLVRKKILTRETNPIY